MGVVEGRDGVKQRGGTRSWGYYSPGETEGKGVWAGSKAIQNLKYRELANGEKSNGGKKGKKGEIHKEEKEHLNLKKPGPPLTWAFGVCGKTRKEGPLGKNGKSKKKHLCLSLKARGEDPTECRVTPQNQKRTWGRKPG